MNNQNAEYKISENADKVIRVIRTELKRKTFEKRNNLSGNVAKNGGLNIYRSLSFFYSEPNFGPLVEINLFSSNTNESETESKIILKRVNGATYKMHFWGAIIFAIISALVSIYLIIKNGFNSIEILALPIFGILYLIGIELLADYTIKSLIKSVEKMMMSEKIAHKKL